jgi:hypothetical protein
VTRSAVLVTPFLLQLQCCPLLILRHSARRTALFRPIGDGDWRHVVAETGRVTCPLSGIPFTVGMLENDLIDVRATEVNTFIEERTLA